MQARLLRIEIWIYFWTGCIWFKTSTMKGCSCNSTIPNFMNFLIKQSSDFYWCGLWNCAKSHSKRHLQILDVIVLNDFYMFSSFSIKKYRTPAVYRVARHWMVRTRTAHLGYDYDFNIYTIYFQIFSLICCMNNLWTSIYVESQILSFRAHTKRWDNFAVEFYQPWLAIVQFETCRHSARSFFVIFQGSSDVVGQFENVLFA